MRNAMIVFRKEFYRVVSDRRLLIMSVLFPGFMIFMMYSLMGGVINRENEDVQAHEMIIYTENMPGDIKTSIESIPQYEDLNDDGDFDDEGEVTFLPVIITDNQGNKSLETLEDEILNGVIDLYIVFPEDFETALDNYEDPEQVIPTIGVYYNPGEKYSNSTYYNVQGVLSNFAYLENQARFGDDVFPFMQDPVQIFNEEEAQGQEFAMLLPMLIIMFLFSGAMNIGPDSIAGEKERGTIATLLVTPVKRFEIAIGKVLSLSVISLMSATSSFVGIFFGLRNLASGASGNEDTLNVSIYGIEHYLMIIAVLFATVLVIVGIIAVVSTYARTIKEAGMFILPFYFISIIIGVTSMFSGEAAQETILYLIPIYSSVNMLISILTFHVVPAQFLVMVLSSLVYVSILIFVMNKLFQSEKVMFSK